MTVAPGLVSDGSANDAIPPMRGFVYFPDGETGWMTFVMGTC